MYQHFTDFLWLVIFHCLDIPHFVYALTNGHLGGFCLSSITNTALLQTFIHKFLCGQIFSILLHIYLGIELLEVTRRPSSVNDV